MYLDWKENKKWEEISFEILTLHKEDTISLKIQHETFELHIGGKKSDFKSYAFCSL